MIIFTSVDFAGIGATIKVGEGATMKNNELKGIFS